MQEGCRQQLQTHRLQRIAAVWRQQAAEGARLRSTCSVLVHRWAGRTSNAALLAWRDCARELSSDRCAAPAAAAAHARHSRVVASANLA